MARPDYAEHLIPSNGGATAPSYFLVSETCPIMEGKYIQKETVKMLLEMVVFALTLVVAQAIGGYIMMKLMMKQYMSKEFIKKYTKLGMEVASEIAEDFEEYL